LTDYAVRRGPWGKPWVTRDFSPLDYGPDPDNPLDKPLNGYLYERPSDISSNLDTKENLSPYHQAQAVFGVVTEPPPHALIKQFRALASEFTDPWTSAKQEVKELLKLARLFGGEERKSGAGTALHRYSAILDKGEEPDYGASDFEPWLDAYCIAMGRFEVLEWEQFIVADDLDNPGSPADIRCAGSYDKLLRDRQTGEVMIGDFKAGKQDNEWALKPTVQVAIYAHGVHYDQETGRRWPIHPELSLTKGVLIHLPYNGGGEPECCIYPLDLEEGWKWAQQSMALTKARKMRATKKSVLARAKAPERAPESEAQPSDSSLDSEPTSA
jgi:hypothetical protein